MRPIRALILVALLSVLASGVATTLLALPMISLLRTLHLGCTTSSDGGAPELVCPDGVGYVVPLVIVAAGCFGVAFTVGSLVMFRSATPQTRVRVARLLAAPVIGVMLAQAFIAVPLALGGGYSTSTVWESIALAGAGVITVGILRSASLPAQAATLSALGLALVAIAEPVFLLAPLLIALAALLITAAALLFGTARTAVASSQPGTLQPHGSS